MEYAFRRHCRNNVQLGFMDGYGQTEQDQDARIRSTLYDIYLYLIMTIECDYRQYADDSQYFWAKKMLEDTVNSLV